MNKDVLLKFMSLLFYFFKKKSTFLANLYTWKYIYTLSNKIFTSITHIQA